MASPTIDASSASRSLLAFVHMHKTGGTSLEQVFLHDGSAMRNLRHPDHVQTFLDLPEAERERVDGVYGHMPFGIHRHVGRPVIYMTFVRDPVERVLSAYAHNLRHDDEPGAEEIRRLGIAWTARPLNFMCRVLADYDVLETPDAEGRFWWSRGPDFVTRDFLDQAKANLDRCAFIGLTETYEEDVRALAHLPDHPIQAPPTVPRAKSSGQERVNQADLTSEQIAAIRAANRFDIELYEHALRLRDAWGGPLRAGDGVATTATPRTAPSGAPEAAQLVDASWTPASLDWRTLPDQTQIGPAPHALTIEVPQYAYAACTGVLKATHCSLTLRVEATAGIAGLMLVTADGSQELSAEQVVVGGDGPAHVVFDLNPSIAPAILVIRNQEPEGAAGELKVTDAQYGPPRATAAA